jgi:hypothetical protein
MTLEDEFLLKSHNGELDLTTERADNADTLLRALPRYASSKYHVPR